MPATQFQALTEALHRAGALGEPAELHGHLCGLACALGADAGPAWVTELLNIGEVAAAARESAAQELQAFAVATLEALDRGDMSLVLALPADDSPMDDRAGALALWCQGFMHGMSQGATSPETIEKGVTGEIIGDFLEISRASLGQDESLAEAEEAYVELVEFVRVSAQLVYEELHGQRGRGQTH